MFFFFVCGEHTFRKEVSEYQGMIFQCHHCGNMAAHVQKSNPWFTFCWIPLIPLSISGYVDVACRICNFHQPLANRPDVKAVTSGGGGGPPPQQYAPPHGGPQGQAPMRYG
ncbi:hypothetical protein H9Q69_011308 [Fusarium xylarioides]|uniref:Rhodopsin family protein n=1 Tax=Fusarium xylarioides TaxID=221167 RepID=A0A9P7I693_9HYPO|nr:hypothetical protein H9Q70_005747 [Fusarium xylarioides]KAG5774423.1 hypothetical protein H9Q72_000111 [Fusarium xylarioides]KAG5780362.1 hypothetical protein H9Q73_005987 [Fusarium xylarioides]KAG5789632.1 hypothetical protein H9Q69_011308 [Fusarium xylarioides]KAG5810973.1 hypothetical protein H9Q71_005145 [Fusarium xylarioides]